MSEGILACLRCGGIPQHPLPALRCLSRMLIKSHISRRKAGSTRLTFSRSDSFTGCLRRQDAFQAGCLSGCTVQLPVGGDPVNARSEALHCAAIRPKGTPTALCAIHDSATWLCSARLAPKATRRTVGGAAAGSRILLVWGTQGSQKEQVTAAALSAYLSMVSSIFSLASAFASRSSCISYDGAAYQNVSHHALSIHGWVCMRTSVYTQTHACTLQFNEHAEGFPMFSRCQSA